MDLNGYIRQAYGAAGQAVITHALPTILAQFEDPLKVMRAGIRPLQRAHPRRFSDADPFKLVELDPSRIEYVSNAGKHWRHLPGEVVGGDWDRLSSDIDEDVVFRTITDHINRGAPLDIEAYREYYLDHTAGGVQRGWGDTFVQQCERVSELIERIEQDGYRSQRELLDSVGVAALQEQNNDAIHPLLNEIRVDIDRNGSFHFWRCGSHRLAIARALELPSVPALVGTRHAAWQDTRDRVRMKQTVAPTAIARELARDHPDLQDLSVSEQPYQDAWAHHLNMFEPMGSEQRTEHFDGQAGRHVRRQRG